jgi:hypothetical protein
MTPRSRGHGPHGRPFRSVAEGQDAAATGLQGGRIGAERAGPMEAGEPAAPRQAGGEAAFVDGIVGDPRTVAGRSAEDLADQFTAAGYPATVEHTNKRGTSGNAVQVRIQGHPEITNIQVHPGGGRHTPEGSPYWKISTNTQGKTWVIPGDFRGADELGGNVVRYDE